MATKICPDCGETIEARSRICPRCKGRQKPKFGILHKLAAAILVLVVLGLVLYTFNPNP